jgi:hypothetical protein
MALANKPQASFTARYQEQDKFVGMMRNIASKTSAHVTLVVHPRKIKVCHKYTKSINFKTN